LCGKGRLATRLLGNYLGWAFTSKYGPDLLDTPHKKRGIMPQAFDIKLFPCYQHHALHVRCMREHIKKLITISVKLIFVTLPAMLASC
jgi:hypothetical protein